MKQQSHVHVDESPWPVLGVKEWLWVTAGVGFCLFHAGYTRVRRGKPLRGIACRIRATVRHARLTARSSRMTKRVYNGYPVKAQQKCLAHLRRHFKKVVKLGLVFNPVARRFLQGGRNPLELSVGHHELYVLYQGSALPVDGIGEGQAFLDLIDEAFEKHRYLARDSRWDSLPNVGFCFEFKSRVCSNG